MPYDIKQNYGGCKGYAVVSSGSGDVKGCHPSRIKARAQQAALYAAEGDTAKTLEILELIKNHKDGCECDGIGGCECDDMDKAAPCWDGYVQRGMKPGKNGKMVPNCVPVSKGSECCPEDGMQKFWGGLIDPRNARDKTF